MTPDMDVSERSLFAYLLVTRQASTKKGAHISFMDVCKDWLEDREESGFVRVCPFTILCIRP